MKGLSVKLTSSLSQQLQNGNLAAKFEESVTDAFDLSKEEFVHGGKKQGKPVPPFEFDGTVKEELGESLQHGKSCRNDSACPSNTHCNTNRGTSTFHTCVNDFNNLPAEVDDDDAWDYFPEDGGKKCGIDCTSDSDCMSPPGAPYNACGKCGKYSGTLMYRKCYSPEPVVTPKPTPSPTPW